MKDWATKSITALLQAAQQGDEAAFDALYQRVYDELRHLARVVRRGRAGETLNTTALVHETYFKLLPSRDLDWQGKAHFFQVAARAMRQVLVSAARQRMADKRGGGQLTVQFDENGYETPVPAEHVIALDGALDQLEALEPRQAAIIECRFFAGLTVEETAQALGVGSATIKRDWRVARAWLVHQLT